jgi:tetratricopeptide (TPR) repeat protein
MFLARSAWANYQARQVQSFTKNVDDGDVALFRCLTGQRPTWLPDVIERSRQEGITAYTAALQHDPNAIRPLVQRSRLYAAKKETLELALADLDRAQQLQPGFASIRKFRGYVLDELDRKEKGRDALGEAKNFYPTDAEDLYWLGVVARSKEQDYVACYRYFSQALLVAPNDYWIRLERALFGRIPSEEDVRQRLRIELEIAKIIRPDLPFASELIVASKFDPVTTKQEFEELTERFGLDLLRAHDRAEALQKENRSEEAKAILLTVLDQDPGGRTAEKIADLEYKAGHYEEARDWYRRAIREGANYPVAYMKLAHTFTAMKDWNAVEKAYLDGIAEHPKNAFLYWNLGSWYEKTGRIADAEKTYRQGCELPWRLPDYAPLLLARSGTPRKAISPNAFVRWPFSSEN